ncbi:MAG: hypothetical protein ACUVX9_11555 [Anaerolineae bacterium]
MNCPNCRTENKLDAGACIHCGAPLSQPASPPLLKRRRRWLLLGLPVALVGLVAVLLVVLLGGSAGSISLPGAGPATAEEAEQKAFGYVAEDYPEFAGTAPKVTEHTGADGYQYFIVSYGYVAQVEFNGVTQEYPRILTIQMSKDGRDVFISESN